MPDAYFATRNGTWFEPTAFARGPWDPNACHAGPPTALIARAMERLVPDGRLCRLTTEIMRPIPMSGFRVQAELRRPGRSVTYTQGELLDDEHIYARAFGLHLRQLDHLAVPTPKVEPPDFTNAVSGSFPIHDTVHGLLAFNSSVEVRYPPESSDGAGGPTTLWMRTVVPILADEEPTGLQRICPLADSGNGISYNAYLDEVLFVNPDLTLFLHRTPVGEWFASRAISHWHTDGTGMADAELFDLEGPVGRATQNLLLLPK